MFGAVVALLDPVPATHDWYGRVAIWTGLVAGVLATVKLLWHKRSPFRRTVVWIWRRLIGDPLGAWATTWGEAFVARVVTPQFDAVNGRIDDLSARNDEQHAENAGKIDDLAKRLGTTNATQAGTVNDLARINETLTNHLLLNPPLPDRTPTGETAQIMEKAL